MSNEQPTWVQGSVTDNENSKRRERAVGWVNKNCTPVKRSVWSALWDEQLGVNREVGVSLDSETLLRLQCGLWDKHGLLPNGQPFGYSKAKRTVPLWVIAACGLGAENLHPAVAAIETVASPPLFFLDAHEGLGRITTNQIAQALFAMCTSPLEARQGAVDHDAELADVRTGWSRTASGYPRFLFCMNDTRIAFLIQPETARRTDEEVREMNVIRDSLGDIDWETLVVLMERYHALQESKNSVDMGINQFLHARQLKPKRTKSGVLNGMQKSEALSMCDSIDRLANIWINPVSMTRKVRVGRRVRDQQWSLYHKLLSVTALVAPEGEERTQAWRFKLGEWCSEFCDSPNRRIGYQWRQALLYHLKDEKYPKRLAYYFTFHFRQNARHQVLIRSLGDLLDGANIPYTSRYPEKAVSRIEGAIKTLVRNKYVRLKDGEEWLFGPSATLDQWSAMTTTWPNGLDLPCKNYLQVYLQRRLSFRADPVVEQFYEREVRSKIRAIEGPTQ